MTASLDARVCAEMMRGVIADSAKPVDRNTGLFVSAYIACERLSEIATAPAEASGDEASGDEAVVHKDTSKPVGVTGASSSPSYPRCTRVLRAKGVAYPRTCAECGLGPCKSSLVKGSRLGAI